MYWRWLSAAVRSRRRWCLGPRKGNVSGSASFERIRDLPILWVPSWRLGGWGTVGSGSARRARPAEEVATGVERSNAADRPLSSRARRLNRSAWLEGGLEGG